MKLKIITHERPKTFRFDPKLVEVVDEDTGETVEDVVEVTIDRKPNGKARVTIVIDDTEIE